MTNPPSIFVSHGSPTLLIDDVPARTFLQGFPGTIARPDAIIVVSAHNVARRVTVGVAENYRQVADFGGFPEELYRVSYRPPGDPALGERVLQSLAAAGIDAESSTQSGIDHGAWIPVSLMYPLGDIPLVPVSLQAGLDPRQHLKIGAALRSLREEQNVLVVASGSITHNLREFGRFGLQDPPLDYVVTFADQIERWLISGQVDELLAWHDLAPDAARNHPSIEHFMPLFVALGAGSSTKATTLHRSYAFGMLAMDAYAFD
jgi:4,5-DOPA dioxygenase extradiol